MAHMSRVNLGVVQDTQPSHLPFSGSEFPASGVTTHPQFAGPVRFSLRAVSDDPDTQVSEVIDIMRGYVVADADSSLIRDDAANATAGTDPIQGIFDWVKARMIFQQDAKTSGALGLGDAVETLVRPIDISLQTKRAPAVEDCDGFGMYTAALLSAAGVPSSWRTVAVDGRDPNRYSHVYAVAYPPHIRDWESARDFSVAMDTSHGDYPGWEVPNMFGKKAEWPVESFPWCSLISLAGLVIGAMTLFEWKPRWLREVMS